MADLYLSYAGLKQVAADNGLRIAYSDMADGYRLVAAAKGFSFQVEITGADAADFESTLKSGALEAESPHEALAFALSASGLLHSNLDASGLPRVSSDKPAGEMITYISPDWCDKTTWYGASVRVEDETPTDSGDHTTYSLEHGNVIDSCHGKLSDEDYLYLTNPMHYTYRVAVTVNGIEKVEVDPHTDEGDFTVDYAAGTITFASALAAEDVVLVSYHYATTSDWCIWAPPSTQIEILSAEVQFTTNILITDSIVFDFIHYDAQQGVVVDGPSKIFKGIKDYLNDSTKSYPNYTAMGGDTWRGLELDTRVFDWDYSARRTVYSSASGGVRIRLAHDKPFEGKLGAPAWATASVYTRGEPETTG